MFSIVLKIIHPQCQRTNLLKAVHQYRFFRIGRFPPAGSQQHCKE